MTRGLSAGLLLLAVSSAGCAGYSITKGGEGPGYDIYAPAPYLLRKPHYNANALVGFDFEVVMLPDREQRYKVRSWAGLSKANFTFEFADGWKLTKIVDQSDNSGVLDAITDMVKHFVPTNPFQIDNRLPKQGADFAPPPSTPDWVRESLTPVLYKIEFDNCGRCVGLQRVCEWDCCSPANHTPLPWEAGTFGKRPTPVSTPIDNTPGGAGTPGGVGGAGNLPVPQPPPPPPPPPAPR